VWSNPETSHEAKHYHESHSQTISLDLGDKRSVAVVIASNSDFLFRHTMLKILWSESLPFKRRTAT